MIQAEQPIRVLHVIGVMNRGGAETMIMNLYRHIDRTKIQFDFVEHRQEEAAFDAEIRALGGRIYRCPGYNLKNLIHYARWWDRFFSEHRGEYTAVHGHMGSTAAIYLWMAKRHGIYTIAHSHNTNLLKTTKDAVYAAASYPVSHIADFFFACSAAAGRSRYGKRIETDTKRFRILHNAIDLSQFSYSQLERQQVRRELGLSDEVLIGHVGRFNEQKNHGFLLNIFEKVHELAPNANLLLVGDGPLRAELEREIQARSLERYVHFTGVVTEVARYYQAMDVLVFPSLYEGLPVTLVEAQAAGLPCLISDRITSEIMLTDSICSMSLQKSPQAWAEMALRLSRAWKRESQASRLYTAGYDISQTAEELQVFYRSIH